MLAVDLFKQKEYENSASLNNKAIIKFQETLHIDSTHRVARSALGHSYYLVRQFDKSISWFEEANRIDGEAAVNFRELGLSRINLGQVPEGYRDLQKAFELDKSQEIRSITTDDLYDIGKLAFDYGDGYIKQGEIEKGKQYKLFSIDVLRMAFDINNKRKDIAHTIGNFAEKMGDKVTAEAYRKE